MKNVKTLVASAVVSAGLALGMAPAPAQAQSIVDIARVIVDANDIVYRSGVPYYRYGNYGPQDRIIVVREGRYTRYYRNAPRGVAHGYYGTQPGHNKYKNYSKWRKQEQKRYEKARKQYNKGHRH